MASNFYHDDTLAEIKNAKVRPQGRSQCKKGELMRGKSGASFDYHVNFEWQEGSDLSWGAEGEVWNGVWAA